MGWALSCLVVEGSTPEEVAAGLGLDLADDRVTEDDAFSGHQSEGPSLALRPDGVVVVADPHFTFDEDTCVALSRGGLTVHQVTVEEHTMMSWGACWTDGVQTWSVLHDAERDIEAVQVSGTPPQSMPQMLRDARATTSLDRGVDAVFDVPVDLVAQATGFRHDHEVFGDQPAFRPLLPSARPRRRWNRRKS